MVTLPIEKLAGIKCADETSCAMFHSRFQQSAVIGKCTEIFSSPEAAGIAELGKAISACVTECWNKLTEKCRNNPAACFPGIRNEISAIQDENV